MAPKRRKSAAGANRSVKTARLLDRLGVEKKLAAGRALVTVEPTFLLSDGRAARLAFERDEEHELCVGYAVDEEGEWKMEEAERFSVRTLGYYRRRLKRIGEREDPYRDPDADLDSDP